MSYSIRFLFHLFYPKENVMSKKVLSVLVVGALLSSMVSSIGRAEEEGKKKYPTKVIMKEAMKGPLLKKVASGEASEEEMKELYIMMVALSENEPKRGEMDSWKEKTTALVAASKAAVEVDTEAGEMLKKAADCKACHTPHK